MKLTKKEIQAAAKKLLKDNPNEQTVYATEDGNLFFNLNYARNHNMRVVKGKNLIIVNRGVEAEKEEKPEEETPAPPDTPENHQNPEMRGEEVKVDASTSSATEELETEEDASTSSATDEPVVEPAETTTATEEKPVVEPVETTTPPAQKTKTTPKKK